jgi:hypothetical protein
MGWDKPLMPSNLALQRARPAVAVSGIIKVILGGPVR